MSKCPNAKAFNSFSFEICCSLATIWIGKIKAIPFVPAPELDIVFNGHPESLASIAQVSVEIRFDEKELDKAKLCFLA